MNSSISLRKISVPDSVLTLIKSATAHRYSVLPLWLKEEILTIAVLPDADVLEIVDAVENETALTVDYRFADDPEDLLLSLKRYYPMEQPGAGSSAEALFHTILNRSLLQRASDIHICPDEEGALVLMRIDGSLWPDRRLSTNILTELTAVIKIAADLDIAEKRTPLDGSINIMLDGTEISLRVATIPTIHGEHITLRLLSQDHSEDLEKITSLGMSAVHEKLFLSALSDPNGIILLSGPTGSGKTTTLYAALRKLKEKGSLHLVSIEDPVEKPVAGVTQIRIDADSDRLTFHKALRSVLRHDPDVIMIGEIRDGETADIAVKSALTGHLVLSTLHTNSASGVLTRLVNMGIAPFLAASTLRLAIAQRLVRVPCSHCVRKRRPTKEECEEFSWDSSDETLLIPEAVGCDLCGSKGYAGRIGLYELIPIDNELRKMILRNADEQEFEHYAFKVRNLPSLHDDGADKIKLGLTTIQEVRDVTNTNF